VRKSQGFRRHGYKHGREALKSVDRLSQLNTAALWFSSTGQQLHMSRHLAHPVSKVNKQMFQTDNPSRPKSFPVP